MNRVISCLLVTSMMVLSSLGAGMASGAAPATDRAVICTGDIVQEVFIDANGNRTHAPHVCPDCIENHIADIPAPAPCLLHALPIPLGTYVQDGCLQSKSEKHVFAARAPPVAA